jgi:hypothetical protein
MKSISSAVLAGGLDSGSSLLRMASHANADIATSTPGPSASAGATFARWLYSFARSSALGSTPCSHFDSPCRDTP